MQYEFRDLQKFITDQLCNAYHRRGRTTLTVHYLLTLITKNYEIYITQPNNNGKCDVMGNGEGCGYNIVIDSIFLIEKMNKTGIIEYYEQGGAADYNFDEIIGDSSLGHDLHGSISGTAVEYIRNHGGDSIWVSPDIESFEKYGFVSEGLFLTRQQANDAKTQVQEAIKQTKYARRTLCYSVIALFVSILTMFISIISMIAGVSVPIIIDVISKFCH